MFGSINGEPVRERPHRDWLDDIPDWYGMELHQLLDLAQTGATWRQIVSRVLDTDGR